MESPSNQSSPSESYVTLRINAPECSLSKTIKFNANQTVQEAITVIKQKIGNQFLEQILTESQYVSKSSSPNSAKKTKADLKEKKKSSEFGLYLESRNVWLDDPDILSFYEIRDMETLDFKLKPESDEKLRRNSLTGSLRKKIASSFRRKSDADSTQSSAKEALSATSSPRSRRNSSNYITPAMLSTIPCQEGHYRVVVECPNTISQHMAEFDRYVTVQQLKEAVSGREKIEDPQNFAMYIRITVEPRETQARLANEHSTLFDYKVHELGRNLVLKRFWLPLNIRLEDGKTVKWLVSPSWTVHFILRLLKKIHGLKNKGYGLFLVTAKSQHRRQNSLSENSSSETTSSQPTSPLLNYEGMLMEKKRKLASYRLGINDILEFKSESLDLKKKLEANTSEENNNADLFIVIESPDQGIAKTFHFPIATTIAEVIETFILKNPLLPYTDNDSSSSGSYKKIFGEDDRNFKRYNLFQKQSEGSVTPPSPSRNQQSSGLTKLDYSQPLRAYKLPHMARLIIKQSDENPNVQNTKDSKPDYFKFTSNIVDAEAGYGVPLQSLPYMTDDTGLKVPVVLALLRKCLVDKNGFEQEGIFRVNGMETQCTEFRKVIGATLSKTTDSSQWELAVSQLKDVNCAATLIKRWYLNLPTKILAGISLATLQQWKEEQASVTELVSKLDEPAKSVFHYLMDLALEVVRQQEVNKMSAKGIARLFSAILVDFSAETPQKSLEISSMLSNILEVAINVELLMQEFQDTGIEKEVS